MRPAAGDAEHAIAIAKPRTSRPTLATSPAYSRPGISAGSQAVPDSRPCADGCLPG